MNIFFFSFIKFTNGSFNELTNEVKSNAKKKKGDECNKANHKGGHCN